jgi:L-seryl-tRNA(Ser) seleniumtransferase
MVEAVSAYGQAAVSRLIRERLDDLRHGSMPGADVTSGTIAKAVAVEAQRRFSLSPSPVLNATGTIIHPHLGRAPLSEAAIDAIRGVASGYSATEFDVDRGMRSSRNVLLAPLLSQMTGADDGFVTNTNSAGILLMLAALARGREVIVSHGQATESSGSFRLSTILGTSGARLVEVGTTNRTRVADYAEAITPKTGLILNINSSVLRSSSFIESVALGDLVALGHHHGIPVIDDQGSGCMLDVTPFGLAREPTVLDSLAAGADAVCFSGDKLFGGPQSGIAVGGADFIARARRHPLMRTLRVDKTTLAALHATVLHYLRGEALEAIPVWRMIAAPRSALEARALAWLGAVQGLGGCKAGVMPGLSSLNGSASQGETIPTSLLSLRASASARGWASHIMTELRHGQTPVLTRVEEGAVLLDPRTVLPSQDTAVAQALRTVLAAG